MGAGSPSSTAPGGLIIGSSVLKASGRRRVKNNVEACRYVLEMWDVWRDAVVEDESDEMDEESNERAKGSELATVAVGLRVAV